MSEFVVFKLGGSLLTLPDLADRLRAVWAMWPGASILTVVGGGTAADVVRDWDATHGLGEEAAHWLAIEALELSARFMLHLVPELRFVRSQGQMQAAFYAGHPALLCAKCFVKWLDGQANALPHVWEVTTDSIAAAVTRKWQGQELVLLKSCDAPASSAPNGLQQFVAEGGVDSYFPQAIEGVPKISWVNLRRAPVEHRWPVQTVHQLAR